MRRQFHPAFGRWRGPEQKTGSIVLEAMEQAAIDRIIEMAWEDRTPFEAIKIQFGLSEAAVITLMRRELKRSSFNL